jgi:hypothetical protein
LIFLKLGLIKPTAQLVGTNQSSSHCTQILNDTHHTYAWPITKGDYTDEKKLYTFYEVVLVVEGEGGGEEEEELKKKVERWTTRRNETYKRRRWWKAQYRVYS